MSDVSRHSPGDVLGEGSEAHRDRRQVEEVYTITQVAELTGVPNNTIRSWERRFHVPRPGRSGGNQRRYSQSDVDVIRSIQASRGRGRTMEQAIRDLDADIDGLVGADPSFPVPEPGDERQGPEAHIQRLIDALVVMQGDAAESIVGDATWTCSIEESCFDLLLASHVTMSRLSAEGRISPCQANYGNDWISRKLLSAFDASGPDTGRATIVVAGMHDSSARWLGVCHAIALSRAGYRVHWIGGDVSARELPDVLERTDPVGVILVAGSDMAAVAVNATIAAIEANRIPGTWQGAVLMACHDTGSDVSVQAIPPHGRKTVQMMEEALRRLSPGLHLVRNE